MAPRSARSVLALEGAVLPERSFSAMPAPLDLDLRRGEVALVHVDDDRDAAAMVDLCVGLAVPAGGQVRFLGVDWRMGTRPQRLHRRRRIGLVAQTGVWPSHMTVMEAILLAPLYHFAQDRSAVVAEATDYARLFGLPGLPAERRDATSHQTLIRAGCVRGFLGSPDLVLVEDRLLERMPELAAPMAQAISAIRRRGGAVLWIVAEAMARAAQFIDPDHAFRLGSTGLIPIRRLQ
jgi:phospholipid/cholesterol/gamma-HCH transport system ATP-binding protein